MNLFYVASAKLKEGKR